MEIIPYRPYQIPPNFRLARLHRQACFSSSSKSTETMKCPCCSRQCGNIRLSVCQYLHRFVRMGEAVPNILYTQRLTIFLMIIVIVLKAGDYIFLTDNPIDVSVSLAIAGQSYRLTIGYFNTDPVSRLIELAVLALLIVGAKCLIRSNKYHIMTINQSVSPRSLILQGVPKEAQQHHVRSLFPSTQVQRITFTYSFSHYQARILQLNYLEHLLRRQQTESGRLMLARRRQNLVNQITSLKAALKHPDNRLGTVLVTFASQQDRQQSLKMNELSPIVNSLAFVVPRLLSKSTVKGYHVSVKQAPPPEDLDWSSLEESSFKATVNQILTNFCCFTVIAVGFLSEYIFYDGEEVNLQIQLAKAIFVQFLNFFIVTLLDFSAQSIEGHRTNTALQLSLLKKQTAYLFCNLSLPSMVTYVLSSTSQTDSPTSLLGSFGLSMLFIGLGNVVKPLMTFFSVERVVKAWKQSRQQVKGQQSQLTQRQANKLFEPIQFPAATMNSLFLSSLLTTFMFLSVFQLMLVLQLVALILLFFSTKYLVARVCKQPLGLSRKLSNLSQKLLSLIVLFNWVGKTVCGYYLTNSPSVYTYLFQNNLWSNVLEIIVVVSVTFLSDKLTSKLIKHHYANKKKGDPFLHSSVLLTNSSLQTDYDSTNPIHELERQLKLTF